MDFSNGAFQPPGSSSKVSNDTMSHTNMVMACRWGWTSTPDPGTTAQTSLLTSSAPQSASAPTFNVRSKRFAPCQGRLYHQLLCSHRVRTDLVEDCGANCVEPFGNAVESAFICNECIQAEATKIWEERKAQHNATYPSIDQMTKEQYDQYYEERRQLEAEFTRDRKGYEMELRAKMRPSNICSANEASKEEMDFAAEIDSLSLSMMASNASAVDHQPQTRGRISLPNDASEQLHWDLNTLALERGSCGIEYTATQPDNGVPAMRRMNDDELWRKPRDRD
ncbi:Nn.00g007680.m01.CDS01 [Neocucurbitaria sp. VM-36]